MQSRNIRSRRRGNILVLAAVMMVMMIAMLAFAVDLGYVVLVRTQLQSSADAAAMAATWDLVDNMNVALNDSPTTIISRAAASARLFAQYNRVAGAEPSLADSDVRVGRLDLTAGRNAVLTFNDPSRFNAARVLVRRQSDINGEVPMFFARVLGVDSCPGHAEATAAFIDNFSGFKPPGTGNGNLNILPFALKKESWDQRAGSTDDNWTWQESTGHIVPGPDGIPEVSLYPQGTDSPGNCGTVDIGSSNNSTADISRQIREGVSPSDLEYLGGKLELGLDGTLQLNGDTGVSAGVKDDVQWIIDHVGEPGVPNPGVVPLFSAVVGPGNNAQYTIVGFAGVRVMEVTLTGKKSNKRVVIQPARVQINGGIPGGDDTPYSDYIYSQVWLVR